ncbi:hypothetical protein KXR64_21850 [Brucella intermedia]|uniref:hypothetical protein n=1 Tax=Brucella TaxID=234 RepID=UPI00147B2859|nr:hypothetical protein [Brucella intermedia]
MIGHLFGNEDEVVLAGVTMTGAKAASRLIPAIPLTKQLQGVFQRQLENKQQFI